MVSERPPRAHGTTWSYSRNSVASHRRPSGEVNAQRPPSRFQTARRIDRGMNREPRPFREACLFLVFRREGSFIGSSITAISASRASRKRSSKSPEGYLCRRIARMRSTSARMLASAEKASRTRGAGIMAACGMAAGAGVEPVGVGVGENSDSTLELSIELLSRSASIGREGVESCFRGAAGGMNRIESRSMARSVGPRLAAKAMISLLGAPLAASSTRSQFSELRCG